VPSGTGVEVTIWTEEFMGKEFLVIVGRGTATACAVQPENKTADKVRRIRKGRRDCVATAPRRRFVALEAPLALTGLKGMAP
jgi:hypothetical protein